MKKYQNKKLMTLKKVQNIIKMILKIKKVLLMKKKK